MFNLFKPKKIFKVTWKSSYGLQRCDVIEAVNSARAWSKIKKRHGNYAAYCIEIKEL